MLVTMRDALAGRLSDPCLAACLPRALRDTIAEQRVFEEDFPAKRFKFQRQLGRRLLPHMFPDDLPSTFLRRFVRYHSPAAAALRINDMCALREFSASLPSVVSFFYSFFERGRMHGVLIDGSAK